MQGYVSELFAEVQRPSRPTLVDIGLVGAIALVVATIHVVAPPKLQTRLALDYQQIGAASLFTSAFVHYSNEHLLNNLTGYLAAVGIAYTLSRQAGRRHWFRVTLVALVVLLPVLVNLSSYVTLASIEHGLDIEGRGFSGVVAGCVGFAFVALLVWIREQHTSSTAMQAGVVIFLGLVLELSIIYTGSVSLEVGLVSSVGFGLSGWQLVAGSEMSAIRERLPELAIEGTYVVLMAVMIGLLVFALFPATITTGGTTTNIIAHGAGFALGVAVSGVVYSLTAMVDESDRRTL